MRRSKVVSAVYGVSGLALMLCGVGLGLWLGIWVMFIGGIIQVVEAIKATPVSAVGLAVGLARFFLAGVAGMAVGAVVSYIGWKVFDKA